jgi:metal-responsive CopG/Arc/MetJ family transcriptional regulator
MKVKTSVTLDPAILKAVDRLARKGESRSQAIERLLADGVAALERRAGDERDRALLDLHADSLNAQAADALTYQADV